MQEYIDKLKNAPNNLSNLKRKADKLDVDKLVLIPLDLIKLCDTVKKSYVTLRFKILKIKYLILQT